MSLSSEDYKNYMYSFDKSHYRFTEMQKYLTSRQSFYTDATVDEFENVLKQFGAEEIKNASFLFSVGSDRGTAYFKTEELLTKFNLLRDGEAVISSAS